MDLNDDKVKMLGDVTEREIKSREVVQTADGDAYLTRRSTTRAAEEILGLYFPILDHGFVALVDYMGTDQDVDRAARVSYGATGSARKPGEIRNLIRYLRRHAHTTPSEMVELKFHCSMPIFIARQWIRARTANVNEQSGRYSLLPMLFYTPDEANFRPQSKTNKQGRSDEELDSEVYEKAVVGWHHGREHSQKGYEWLAAHDVANELARIDLPLSTYTQWYWKIDLHNLMHFLGLRADSHAQWEIQQYASVMAGMMKRVAPLSYEAWVDYNFCGRKFSRGEMKVLRALMSKDGDASSPVRPLENEHYLHVDADLSDREISEFKEKLKPVDPPNHDLDLSLAKPGSFFEETVKAATPKAPEKKG